jgi:hypothetical protein
LYSDDLHNFQVRASDPQEQQKSILQLASPEISQWKNTGRYTPLSFLWMELVFKHFTTVASYKLLVLFLNMLAVGIFLVYLSQLCPGMHYTSWLIGFGGVIQYRITYHDAYTSLNGMYQLLAMIVFATLIAYHYYMLHGKPLFLLLSVLCFLSGILISEVGLLVILLIPVSALIIKIPFRKFMLSVLPYIFVGIVYLGYIAWLRAHMQEKDVYIGLVTRYDFHAMVTLFGKQTFASFPLTNLYHKRAIPKILLHQFTDPVNVLSILVIVGIAYIIFRKQAGGESHAGYTSPAAYLYIAAALVVFPALFILPSVKYQSEVQWGVGYLPVYFQNFGAATFFTWLFRYCALSYKKAVRRFSVFVYIFLVLCTCIAFLFNNALIKASSYNSSFPARVFYETIRSGMLKDCKAGSTIILGHNFFWRAPELYQEIFKNTTGKNFRVIESDVEAPIPDSTDCYFLDCHPGSTVTVSLYRVDKRNENEKVLIRQEQADCPIRVTEDENSMFH